MDCLWTIDQIRESYLQEIARKTPPRNNHDEFMLEVYQRLLDDIEWFLQFGGSHVTEVPE